MSEPFMLWVHCSPMFVVGNGSVCENTERRPCACPFEGSHDHLVLATPVPIPAVVRGPAKETTA